MRLAFNLVNLLILPVRLLSQRLAAMPPLTALVPFLRRTSTLRHPHLTIYSMEIIPLTALSRLVLPGYPALLAKLISTQFWPVALRAATTGEDG